MKQLFLRVIFIPLLLVLLLLPPANAKAVGIFTATGSMNNARFDHTATLLPNGKVLVTGGRFSGSGYRSSAELYDSATGTFTDTGSLNNARGYHTATLLPNGKVLIAGGIDSINYLGNAELYDPANGTFTSTGSLNIERRLHTATLLPNGKVLIAGGENISSGVLSSAELYDPTTETFTTTGSMNSARGEHTATLLPSGKVLIAGGSAELYDPATGTFTATGSMNIARSGHTATLLPSGKVLIAGGGSFSDILSSSEVYDPADGTFTTASSMNTARYYSHTATLQPNGKVLIAGGSGSGVSLSSAEVYDPATGTFATTGSMNTARDRHTTTLLPNGNVLIAGGINGSSYHSSAELYDPTTGPSTVTFNNNGGSGTMTAQITNIATALKTNTFTRGGYAFAGWNTAAGGGGTSYADGASYPFTADITLYAQWTALVAQEKTFTTTGSMSIARDRHTATLLPNGKVLIAGGYVGSGYLSSAELYDPATGTFTATGSMNIAREYHTATLLRSGKVLIAGGDDNISGYQSSAELYDPATGTFTTIGTFPSYISLNTARNGHTATLLPDGRVLIAGGQGVSGNLSSAELYDPVTETFTTIGMFPSYIGLNTARYGHTATLLPYGRVLIAGGYDISGPLSSAELYEPTVGSFLPIGSMNIGRFQHIATLLPSGKVLIAGGLGDSGYLSSAELYDPDTGTFTTTGSMNIARSGHTGTLLLIAGGIGISGYLSSAELYDPATGTFTATGGLNIARSSHTATLLPGGKVLIAGGSDISGRLSSAELYYPATGTFAFTVIFNNNNGSGTMTAQTTDVATALTINTFTRAGYTFAGWNTVAGGGGTSYADGTSYPFTADVTLYAQWTVLPIYTVTYNANGGSGTMTDTSSPYLAGATVTVLSNTFTRSGYTFAGWYPNADGSGTVYGASFTMDSADVTLYAKWTALVSETGTFTPTGSLNNARQDGHTATLLPNGKVLIAGGADNNPPLRSAELYDPATGTFTATGSMNVTRQLHSATLLLNGKVLIAGGNGGSDRLNSAELYDPATGTFTATGSMNVPRELHSATLLPSGKVLIAGGSSSSGMVSSTELYDPDTEIFTTTGNMNSSRQMHTATLLPSGKVLLAGGGGHNTSAELYDPTTKTFTATGSMNSARDGHTATLLPSGKVLIVTGQIGNPPLRSAELYDPATGTFSNTGSMNIGRVDHTATLLPSGKVLIAGGYYINYPESSAELYDPATGTFTASGSMNIRRFNHTAILLPSGKVLIAGGYSVSATSAELFDPATGTYTVTFSNNNGSGTMTAQTANGATVLTANTFTRTGYSFSGWNTAAGGGGTSYADGASYPFTVDVTLYAQWTALPTHTVTYNANGGSGTMTDASSPYLVGATVTVKTNTFAKSGYTFTGWYPNADGSGSVYGASFIMGSADTVLYAKWTVSIAPPTATTGTASSIKASSATLNGTVNDNGGSTIVNFEYDTTTSYSRIAGSGNTVASGAGSTPVAVTINELSCNTTYHFRINGQNSAGITNGSDVTFTTGACPVTCGTNHAGVFNVAPETNLCSLGAPSSVTGNGPWSWTCNNNGSIASCTAYLEGKAAISLPRTGQTTCYDFNGFEISCADTGWDAEFKAGAAWPVPRFTINLKADNVTSNGTVTDNLTGLIWSNDAHPAGYTMAWQNALDYVNTLNSQGHLGYGDWRLPNINELRSLIDYSKSYPALPNGYPFINVQNDNYWSSSSNVPFWGAGFNSIATIGFSPQFAWVVRMQSGDVAGYMQKNDINFSLGSVWPVRGGQTGATGVVALPKTGQTVCYDSNGTIRDCAGTGEDGEFQMGAALPNPVSGFGGFDNLTGLTWGESANLMPDRDPLFDQDEGMFPINNDGAVTWQHALDYIKKLNDELYLGYHDWRLPNINELKSAFDDLIFGWGSTMYITLPRNDDRAFYWSSTTVGNSKWIVRAGDCGVVTGDMSFLGYVWPVRGGQIAISATPPAATTGTASSIIATGATLNGTVSSNGASTTVTFDYGTSASYGSTVAAAQSPLALNVSGSAVSAAITGLSCNTTYHFRVNGQNSAGTTNGSEATFITGACAPTVTTGSASPITTTGATLGGTVSSNGAATTVTFNYGTSASYGSSKTASQSPALYPQIL